MTPIRIGTRGSRLALWQADHVADLLRAATAGRRIEVVEIQTAGDRAREAPLSQAGGEGLFTKEIQKALLDGSVDVAVHSLKDLPTLPVEGLELSAVPARGPAGDVFVSRRYRRFDDLPAGATVATGSPRRRAQALCRRADLRLVDIRGNVETRLHKLAEQDIDALILAQAGLERLGLADAITEILAPSWMLPAIGQGALGLESRAGDQDTRAVLARLDDPPTRQAVRAERAMLRALGGGCQVPIGAASAISGTSLSLRGVVLSPDGRRRIESQLEGLLAEAEALGRQLAEELLAQGAKEILIG